MTTFTIETETNNVSAYPNEQDAQAVPDSEHFSSADELATLAANWPTSRLIEIWNGIPGVTPVKKFTDRKAAATRIWKAIQTLSESIPTETASESEPLTNEAAELGAIPAPEPEPTQEPPAPEEADQEVAVPASKEFRTEPAAADVEANAGAQSPGFTPGEEKAATKATRQKNAPTGETVAKAPREGSKTEQVIALLKRQEGVTLEHLMTTMGWQKHTTRTLLSAGGSLTKNHNLIVISEKVGDTRTYFLKD